MVTGAYLNELNLNKIKMYWCNSFNFEHATFGAWTPIFFNSIFLIPGPFDSEYIQYLKNKNTYNPIVACHDIYKNNYETDFIQIKNNKINISPRIATNKRMDKRFK